MGRLGGGWPKLKARESLPPGAGKGPTIMPLSTRCGRGLPRSGGWATRHYTAGYNRAGRGWNLWAVKNPRGLERWILNFPWILEVKI